MAKSSNLERTKRFNRAVDLVQMYSSTSEAAVALAEQYGISVRQAYRYVHEATEKKRQIPVPDRKIPFTVKLSVELVSELRDYRGYSGKTLSNVVDQALRTFLKGQEHGKGT